MNKKIVVLVVLVECILSIFLISYLGRAIENSVKNAECKKIAFVNEFNEELDDGATIEIELSDSVITYQLRYRISPTNTTNKKVTFTSSEPDSVEVDETGLVTFFEEKTVRITVTSCDGSAKKATIILVPKVEHKGNVDI